MDATRGAGNTFQRPHHLEPRPISEVRKQGDSICDGSEKISFSIPSYYNQTVFIIGLDSLDGPDTISDRYFLFAYGPGKKLRITHGPRTNRESVVKEDSWFFDAGSEPEFPLYMEASVYGGETFNPHICLVFLGDKLLIFDKKRRLAKAECTDAP